MGGKKAAPAKATSKGKDKKELRKQAVARTMAIKNLIKTALAIPDVLADFVAFKKYDRNGLTLDIDYVHPDNMSAELKKWTFDLTKLHMQAMYEATWGWKDGEKREDMFADNSRFLIAFDRETRKPMGFACLWFEDPQDLPIVYVYELQIVAEAQRKGLGKFLMQVTELIARKEKFAKVSLTVFKDNQTALNFYKTKMSYILDEASPDPTDEEVGHVVLSKAFYSEFVMPGAVSTPALIAAAPAASSSAPSS